jgi:hypothetical protein
MKTTTGYRDNKKLYVDFSLSINVNKLDTEKVELLPVIVKNHTFHRLLERIGWNREESKNNLGIYIFTEINRNSQIVSKYPHIKNKLNNRPNTRYYFNESHNLILVDVDNDNKSESIGNVLTTCLFLDDYNISRYKNYFGFINSSYLN